MPWKTEAQHVAYMKKYNKAHRKEQTLRVAARRAMEKKYGDLPSTTDVDHRVPLDQGGGNEGNLRLRSAHSNRGYERDAHNNPIVPKSYAKGKR